MVALKNRSAVMRAEAFCIPAMNEQQPQLPYRERASGARAPGHVLQTSCRRCLTCRPPCAPPRASSAHAAAKRAASAVPLASERTLVMEMVSAGPNAAMKNTAPAAWSCSTKLIARSTTDKMSGIVVFSLARSGSLAAWRALSAGGRCPSETVNCICPGMTWPSSPTTRQLKT